MVVVLGFDWGKWIHFSTRLLYGAYRVELDQPQSQDYCLGDEIKRRPHTCLRRFDLYLRILHQLKSCSRSLFLWCRLSLAGSWFIPCLARALHKSSFYFSVVKMLAVHFLIGGNSYLISPSCSRTFNCIKSSFKCSVCLT